jgi:hypothetical protein
MASTPPEGHHVRMRRAVAPLLVVAAATTLTAAGLALAHPIDDSTAGRAANGLQGTVYRGPITPVCRTNLPCEAPAPGVTLEFTRGGVIVGRAKTNAVGKYRILIAPAIYTVITDQRGLGRDVSPFPRRVKVRLGHIDTLDFRIDTGIR